MNVTKKLIITGVIISTLASAGAFARGGNDDNKRGAQIDPAERYEYIFTQLDLTEDQQSSVLDMMKTLRDEQRDTMREAMQALRDSDERPDRETMDAQREAHRTTMMTQLSDQLNTVLSAEDTAEFIEYLDFHSRQMANGERGPKGPRGPRQEANSEGSADE